jgi:hypothetical protein
MNKMLEEKLVSQKRFNKAVKHGVKRVVESHGVVVTAYLYKGDFYISSVEDKRH